jgi:hypothetical protein
VADETAQLLGGLRAAQTRYPSNLLVAGYFPSRENAAFSFA